MKRALVALAVVAGLGLAAAGSAWAQGASVTFYFGASSSDTAIGMAPGAEGTIQIRVSNPSYDYYPYWRVQRARLTVHFDPTKVEVLGFAGESYGLYQIESVTIGSGVATVAAYGDAYGTDAPVLRMRARLLAGASDGAYLWIQPDTVTGNSYSGSGPLTGWSTPGEVCHATQVWGDVDGSGGVDSRDALITLSAAVGLPVSGFNLEMGDADQDGLTNSRDALMMLSYAIDLPIYQVNRLGIGIPDACPGLTAPGEIVVFKRSGSTGGIYRLDAASTTPVAVTTNAGDDYPSLNAAGTSVVFQCPGVSYAQVCKVNLDGSNRLMLTDTVAHTNPEWSPDGTRIAFIQDPFGYAYLMDPLGSSRTSVNPQTATAEVSWTRDGTRLLMSGDALWTTWVDSARSDTILSYVSILPPLRHSPDGGTVAFKMSDGNLWTVPFTVGATSYTRRTPFPTYLIGFDWGPGGVVFAMPARDGTQSLWMLQGGFDGPLVRLTKPAPTESDENPAFRRNP